MYRSKKASVGIIMKRVRLIVLLWVIAYRRTAWGHKSKAYEEVIEPGAQLLETGMVYGGMISVRVGTGSKCKD